jgi:glycosyltransferase involved in cell wall biosynthesis
MVLLINTASTFKGGGVQVALSFIKECRNYPDNTYHVVLSDAVGKLITRQNYPSNFHFYELSYRPASRLFSFKSHNGALKSIEKAVQPDCVFTTSGPAYWRPRVSHLVGFNLPHHIYPDSPYFGKMNLYARVRWFLKKKLHSFYFRRDSDALVTQTHDVSERVKKLLKRDNVFTVSNTCSSHYYDSSPRFSNLLPAKRPGEYRFLTFTAYYPHKNLEIIKEVVPILKRQGYDQIVFVLTIDHKTFHRVFSDMSDCIINVGPVPAEQGPTLYREVDFIFLPTLLECFSANYPEAMVMQKPLLTSDLPFARTVCEDAALYFDPLNAGDIAARIIDLIENNTLRDGLICKGIEHVKKFPGARERAARYLEICHELAR